MHKFYYENNKKNDKKEYENVKFHSELTSLTKYVACSKHQRDGENVTDQKLSVEHTLYFT